MNIVGWAAAPPIQHRKIMHLSIPGPLLLAGLLCYTAIMSTLYSDTHPKIEALQIELIRRMPSWKKFAVVDDLNETVKTLALLGIRQRHPDATPQQVRYLLAEQMLGEELARKVYGDAG
jgi:hypothetical protein